MGLCYSVFKKIATNSQHMGMHYFVDEAIQAINDAECEDQIRAALAVGFACGVNNQRERIRKGSGSTIECIYSRWQNNGSRGIGGAYHSKSFRVVSRAVKQIHGNDDILSDAAYQIEHAAYRIGFAEAMRLIGEVQIEKARPTFHSDWA